MTKVTFSIETATNGTLYLEDLRDTVTEGGRGCNWSFSPDPQYATPMVLTVAARRFSRVRKQLGYSPKVRDEAGNEVTLCLECAGIYSTEDMLPSSDLCRECASEVSRQAEATMGYDW